MSQNPALCIPEMHKNHKESLFILHFQGLFEAGQSDKGADTPKLPWLLCAFYYHSLGC